MVEVTIHKLETTEAISCGSSGNTSSVSSNYEIGTIKGMDPKFYKAAVKGEIDAFKKKGKEIETMLTPNKNTILHIHLTASSVSETFVEDILGMCPTLIVKSNAKGETLLHIAARYGHSIIVNKLIDSAKGFSSGQEMTLIRAIRDDTKDTALHEAVYFKHIEIVDILTKEDPHISDFVNSDGETPLYVAIEREYWDVAQKILDNCKSPNQDGPNGRTALHAAVIRNNKDMVSTLLTRTSVNQADENGWVPLHLAALHKSPDMAMKLLKYDRDTAYKRDKKGRTALHFAAHYGHAKVMETMIKYCPDCAELVDENGYNALHYTSIGGKPVAARLILDNTSLSNLYNEKDNNGNTPLHHLANSTPGIDEDDEDHPLLEVRSRVDTMAFNKQNQTAIDVAFDHTSQRHTSSSQAKSLGHLVKKLRQIGASYGGRITKNKKQKEARDDSASRDQTNKKPKEDDIDRYIDRVRETNMVVAALIATVTFAAGFTVPGGFIQEHDQPHKGSPILMHNPAFQAFVITNTISFVFSASAVLFHIYSLPDDNRDECATYLLVAMLLTMLAMVFMIIAFGTGTYAILGVSKALAVYYLVWF
ncbi:ankyrin repeat-containing protein [Senna tora]|uniref:Ankyrin repeat-containing protein n=1 Tax=Senna tora TaxID=362788 RepID=A0A834W4Y3_9FABA|nr:ankyrin repeat-containing protein [Senna tora]